MKGMSAQEMQSTVMTRTSGLQSKRFHELRSGRKRPGTCCLTFACRHYCEQSEGLFNGRRRSSQVRKEDVWIQQIPARKNGCQAMTWNASKPPSTDRKST